MVIGNWKRYLGHHLNLDIFKHMMSVSFPYWNLNLRGAIYKNILFKEYCSIFLMLMCSGRSQYKSRLRQEIQFQVQALLSSFEINHAVLITNFQILEKKLTLQNYSFNIRMCLKRKYKEMIPNKVCVGSCLQVMPSPILALIKLINQSN